METIKRAMSKKHVKTIVLIVLTVLSASIIFSLLHLSQTGLLLPRAYDRAQHFSQHELYEELKDFELLENRVIRSTSGDPWIIVNTDSDVAGDMLIIRIRNLSVDETSAQVFFVPPGEPFSEENSIRFTLKNGDNTLRLPDSGNAHFRLDLAESPDISMVVSEVTLRHSGDMISTSSFWLMIAILTLICAVVLYFLVFKTAYVKTLFLSAKKMPPDDSDEQENMVTATKRKLVSILYYTAASLMPSIFLFINYNHNRHVSHLVFWHVLILAGIFAVIGIVLFIVVRFVVRNREGALLLSLLFWILFWFYETMFDAVGSMFTHLSISTTAFTVFLVLLLCVIALPIRRYVVPTLKVRQIFISLAFVIVGFFVFNLAPGVNNEIQLHRARAAGVDTEPFHIKREFYIDETLPAPDIYWFHLDGMVSMETMERFFGVPQDHLREELVNRGFILYAEAELFAGRTDPALVSLFSPTFYDTFFGEVLNRYSTELYRTRRENISSDLGNVGLTLTYLRDNYEFTHALIERGYSIDNMFPNPMDNVYRTQHTSFWHRILERSNDLPELLNQTTPINITPISEREDLQIHLAYMHSDYFISRFTFYFYVDTHMYNVWEHDPTITYDDDIAVQQSAIHVYHYAYEQLVQKVLEHVDTILESNSNAVIVLQADHGLHLEHTQNHLLDLGYSLEQVVELVHSVFSAVRIPEQYGGLDAPLAPLNVSRELVNRFVGLNYELLP